MPWSNGCADAEDGRKYCRARRYWFFNGNSSIEPGRATIEETVANFGIFPPQGDHPEDARASSTLISRAFIPPCILDVKDCLSRTSRLTKQAGTLDAHFICCRANAVPEASRFARPHGFRRKLQGLRVVPTHPPGGCLRPEGSRVAPRPGSHLYRRPNCAHSGLPRCSSRPHMRETAQPTTNYRLSSG